jgi:UDP-N-acetylglucosamine--N-acetylmuramyl-(pentapeptide) pyrophosphoryl-undecaprenol N-acetylglucosamine transferase
VVPAIAVAGALRAEGAEVTFAGGQRAEADLVPAAGFEIDPIDVEGISRTNPLKAARAVARATAAVRTASHVLSHRRADAVLGGGGYVAGPVGVAALARRIPLVLTEADSHLGLTNRLLAPRARRVCLAFPIDGRESWRYLLTGRPIPPLETDRSAARAAFGLTEDDTCILVFGGSLGARSINQASVAAFAGAVFRVLHLSGHRDFDALTSPGPHYDLRPYFEPFGLTLLAADLVVARAGGSVFEIAAYGRPAVLVPYPHASGDHQTQNARWMERAGAAIVIGDDELTPDRLAREVGGLLADRPRLAAMGAAARAIARPDAAATVAREVLAAVREG